MSDQSKQGQFPRNFVSAETVAARHTTKSAAPVRRDTSPPKDRFSLFNTTDDGKMTTEQILSVFQLLGFQVEQGYIDQV